MCLPLSYNFIIRVVLTAVFSETKSSVLPVRIKGLRYRNVFLSELMRV